MSWSKFHLQSFQLDATIYNKLARLALDQDDHGRFLAHDDSKLLDDPIHFDKTLRELDPTEIPRINLEELVKALTQENELIYNLFNQVNEERKVKKFAAFFERANIDL